MDLTRQDIDVLLEAVEAWEAKDASGEVIRLMLGAMMCRSKEEREIMVQEEEARAHERKQASQVRKDRSILLRAKLISIRDSMDADRFLNCGDRPCRSTTETG